MKKFLFCAIFVAGLLGVGSFSFAQEVKEQPVQNKQEPVDQRRPEGDLRKDDERPHEDFRKDQTRPREDLRKNNKKRSGTDEKRLMDTASKEMRPEDRERMMKEGQDRMGGEGKEGKERMMEGENGSDQMMGGGMSEEEMAEQEKKQDEHQLRQMKQGMKQFTKGVKRMKSELSKLEKKLAKCGAGVPDELKKAVSASEEAAPKIEAAKTTDELDEVMSVIEDNGELMREWGPKMGDLHRGCDMLKRASADLKKMKKDVAQLENKVKAQKKVDLSELMSELRIQIDVLAKALQKAKDLAKTDLEGALEVLEDEFFEGTSDLFLTREALEMALNVTKGLRQASSELKRYDRMIKKLEKEKKDVAGLKELLGELKAKQKEITDLVNTKKFDPDDLTDLIEEAFDVRDELVNSLEDFGALQDFMPQFERGPGVKFDLPPGFERQEERRRGPSEEESEQEL